MNTQPSAIPVRYGQAYMDTPKEIEEHFVTNNVYPLQACLWEKGKPVYEFPFIVKSDQNKFVVHIQRHYSTDPFTRAEHAHWKFNRLNDAYNKWYQLDNGTF
jgi:hypothetical protein